MPPAFSRRRHPRRPADRSLRVDSSHSRTPTSTTSPRVARYGVRYEGHDIEVRVRAGDVDAERVDVVLDGEPVAPEATTRRSHDIAFETDDGFEIRLHVGGRQLGTLVRVRMRRPDGYWIDLRERHGPPPGH